MRDRQPGHEILRLHAQGPLRRHRQYQVDGIIPRLVQDDSAVSKRQTIKPDDAFALGLVQSLPLPQRIADPGPLGVESHIPREIDVACGNQRLDRNLGRKEMGNPAANHRAKRSKPAPAGGKVESKIEPVAAPPIAFRIGIVEHVDLPGCRNPEHRDQRRYRPRAPAGHAAVDRDRANRQGARGCHRWIQRRR